ncbi:MAG: indole-3-glycerol phosphate synthase [Pseudohongiella sp.]|nr:MAG: indole-3-glycerol phosphate synthase [Pseudohongiella sp.]
MTTPTILQEIIAQKHREIAQRRGQLSLAELEAKFPDAEQLRPFAASLRAAMLRQSPAVIAEIKKASPSKGLIRADFDPVAIAKDYEAAGACCLSVLTDNKFFQGSEQYMQQARAATRLPVIRKDFMVDSYQIAESRALGADCVLLIVAALDPALLAELANQAQEIGLDSLVEVHNRAELELALQLGVTMVGINNRDLHSFETSLDVTLELAKSIPDETLIVTESGIHTRADVEMMLDHGIYGFLVGESFMRAPSPGAKLRELMFPQD